MEWATQVTALTGSPPGKMKGPKSWFLQTRHPIVYAVVGGVPGARGALAHPAGLAGAWATAVTEALRGTPE